MFHPSLPADLNELLAHVNPVLHSDVLNYLSVDKDDMAAEWAPLAIVNKCLPGMPVHWAPCLQKYSRHSGDMEIVFGEEIIYPSFAIREPLFINQRQRADWYRMARPEVNNYFAKWIPGISPGYNVFPRRHGSNFIFGRSGAVRFANVPRREGHWYRDHCGLPENEDRNSVESINGKKIYKTPSNLFDEGVHTSSSAKESFESTFEFPLFNVLFNSQQSWLYQHFSDTQILPITQSKHITRLLTSLKCASKDPSVKCRVDGIQTNPLLTAIITQPYNKDFTTWESNAEVPDMYHKIINTFLRDSGMKSASRFMLSPCKSFYRGPFPFLSHAQTLGVRNGNEKNIQISALRDVNAENSPKSTNLDDFLAVLSKKTRSDILKMSFSELESLLPQLPPLELNRNSIVYLPHSRRGILNEKGLVEALKSFAETNKYDFISMPELREQAARLRLGARIEFAAPASYFDGKMSEIDKTKWLRNFLLRLGNHREIEMNNTNKTGLINISTDVGILINRISAAMVGMHGGQLYNARYCAPGTPVLEILSRFGDRHRNKIFNEILHIHGLPHAILLVGPSDIDSIKLSDFPTFVPPSMVSQLLRNLLKNVKTIPNWKHETLLHVESEREILKLKGLDVEKLKFAPSYPDNFKIFGKDGIPTILPSNPTAGPLYWEKSHESLLDDQNVCWFNESGGLNDPQIKKPCFDGPVFSVPPPDLPEAFVKKSLKQLSLLSDQEVKVAFEQMSHFTWTSIDFEWDRPFEVEKVHQPMYYQLTGRNVGSFGQFDKIPIPNRKSEKLKNALLTHDDFHPSKAYLLNPPRMVDYANDSEDEDGEMLSGVGVKIQKEPNAILPFLEPMLSGGKERIFIFFNKWFSSEGVEQGEENKVALAGSLLPPFLRRRMKKTALENREFIKNSWESQNIALKNIVFDSLVDFTRSLHPCMDIETPRQAFYYYPKLAIAATRAEQYLSHAHGAYLPKIEFDALTSDADDLTSLLFDDLKQYSEILPFVAEPSHSCEGGIRFDLYEVENRPPNHPNIQSSNISPPTRKLHAFEIPESAISDDYKKAVSEWDNSCKKINIW